MNIIVVIKNDDRFKQDIIHLADGAYTKMPLFNFLYKTIGKESYNEKQALSNGIETKTWTWFWDGKYGSILQAEQITFVFNEKYAKEAMEFKLKYA